MRFQPVTVRFMVKNAKSVRSNRENRNTSMGQIDDVYSRSTRNRREVKPVPIHHGFWINSILF